jgi:UDP-GlcNAc3NAcA epimerase
LKKSKILTIVGARPQIIKAAAISREIHTFFSDKIQEVILHTGQHYDANMSGIFFSELGIPQPDYNLNVGSGLHGEQTALMIKGIERVIVEEKPDLVLVYGDTNSTLAGALAASKLHVPVAHVEAGLRSFNKSMPEEINRIVCDHVSTWLFVPTVTGMQNLKNEGFRLQSVDDCFNVQQPFSSILDSRKNELAGATYSIDNPGIFHTGDIMYDNSLYFSELALRAAPVSRLLKERIGWAPEDFILATIHRDSNTDDPSRVNAIFSALADIAEGELIPVIVPLHPRTSKLLHSSLDPAIYERVTRQGRDARESCKKGVILMEPVSYLEMISLERAARLIITDSGGVQKEAFFFKKPSLILRPQTEWVEIVDCGAAILADADYHRIIEGCDNLELKAANGELEFPSFFGDGKAASSILRILSHSLNL